MEYVGAWLVYLGIAAAWVVPPVAIFYLGLRFVRAQERRALGAQDLAELKARMLGLEERLEDLSDDLGRLNDGQRFTTRLLAGRSAEPPEPEAASRPNDR